MAHIVITQPTELAVSVADARLHCNAISSDDDYLTICIKGATKLCEGIIKQVIMQRTVEVAFDAFPESAIALEVRPAVSITHVKYTNTSGSEQTLASNTYLLDVRQYEPWLLPALNTAWPATEETINAVRVRYVAGMVSATANVPDDLRTWLLLTVGYLFAQRESFDMTGKTSAIPSRFVDSLLDPYRVY